MGSVAGVPASNIADKLWLAFQALGDIAFAYPYTIILLEIQVPFIFQMCLTYIGVWYRHNELHSNAFIFSYYIQCWRVMSGVCITGSYTIQSLRLNLKHWTLFLFLNWTKDTLESPPAENKTMKKASMIAILITTFFYLCCACFGYAAFGNQTPGNLLTGFGFYEPYWLIDFANACIVLHLVGGYQVIVLLIKMFSLK